MRTKRPPYLHREKSRHGVVAWYVRREHGARIRIRGGFDSPEFWAEYRSALEGAPIASKAPKSQTLEWAIDRYRDGSQWSGYSVATRRQHEAIFHNVIATAGTELLSRITAATIVAGRERRAATPHSANNFLKAMRGFFKWAAGDGKLVAVDPTRGVRLLKGANDDVGFHTWTEEEVERFEARWPLGTRERLAFDILLYTGFRRGDAVRLGRQHVRDGVISLRTEKTGDTVTIPVLAPLAASLAATPTGDLTFLTTGYGRAFVKEGFGNWFREACTTAKCPGSAHGLRKAGAVRAAENGATVPQLMAIFGWTTEKMAALYTRAADRKRLGMDGAALMLRDHSQNEKRPHRRSGAGAKPKSRN
jgi:integrase